MAVFTHPDVADLEAFTLGTLDGVSLSEVEAHIADCSACQERAAGGSGDSLVELLRRAHAHMAHRTDTVAEATAPGQTPAPVAGDGAAVASAQAASATLDLDLGELARHERYRIVRLLGEGGMGCVYEAEHRVMARAVALKVINRALTARPAVVERFRREVRAAARLAHPNIVTTYDAEDAGDGLFLVMEYVEGVNLGRLVKERGPLPVAEACNYIRQAALGLQHAHERRMVHRDVKPENLIRCADGTVKVLDFGLAALTAERGGGLTDANVIMGTPDYMAPEQAEDPRAADIRSDVYSLGCTLYFLLTGSELYPAATAMQKILAHRDQPLPNLRQVCSDVHPELARVVARMLAKKAEDRFQTPGAVAAALKPFTRPASVEPPRKRRRPLVAIAAAALFAGIILAGAVVYRIQTDRGELVITTENDDVEVVVKQGGNLVRIIDTKTDKSIILRSGVYELELNGAPAGLKLNLDTATLIRGETVLAKIERVPRLELQKPGFVRTFPSNTRRHSSGDFSRDGRLLAVPMDQNDDDKTLVRIYDTATGRIVRDLNMPGEFFASWIFMADGKHLLTTGSAPARKVRWPTRIWDLETGISRQVKQVERLSAWPSLLSLSADGNRLGVAEPFTDLQNRYRVLDVETGRIIFRVEPSQEEGHVAHNSYLLDDGRWLLNVVSRGDTPQGPWKSSRLRLIDLEGKQPRKDIDLDFYLTDPYLLANAGRFGGLCHRVRPGGKAEVWVQTWDLGTGKPDAKPAYQITYTQSAMLRGQGRRIVTLNTDGRLRAFDLPAGKEVFCSDPQPAVIQLGTSFDGRMVSLQTAGGFQLFRLPDPAARKDNP